LYGYPFSGLLLEIWERGGGEKRPSPPHIGHLVSCIPLHARYLTQARLLSSGRPHTTWTRAFRGSRGVKHLQRPKLRGSCRGTSLTGGSRGVKELLSPKPRRSCRYTSLTGRGCVPLGHAPSVTQALQGSHVGTCAFRDPKSCTFRDTNLTWGGGGHVGSCTFRDTSLTG
jgi:hypothetical protein